MNQIEKIESIVDFVNRSATEDKAGEMYSSILAKYTDDEIANDPKVVAELESFMVQNDLKYADELSESSDMLERGAEFTYNDLKDIMPLTSGKFKNEIGLFLNDGGEFVIKVGNADGNKKNGYSVEVDAVVGESELGNGGKVVEALKNFFENGDLRLAESSNNKEIVNNLIKIVGGDQKEYETFAKENDINSVDKYVDKKFVELAREGSINEAKSLLKEIAKYDEMLAKKVGRSNGISIGGLFESDIEPVSDVELIGMTPDETLMAVVEEMIPEEEQARVFEAFEGIKGGAEEAIEELGEALRKKVKETVQSIYQMDLNEALGMTEEEEFSADEVNQMVADNEEMEVEQITENTFKLKESNQVIGIYNRLGGKLHSKRKLKESRPTRNFKNKKSGRMVESIKMDADTELGDVLDQLKISKDIQEDIMDVVYDEKVSDQDAYGILKKHVGREVAKNIMENIFGMKQGVLKESEPDPTVDKITIEGDKVILHRGKETEIWEKDSEKGKELVELYNDKLTEDINGEVRNGEYLMKSIKDIAKDSIDDEKVHDGLMAIHDKINQSYRDSDLYRKDVDEILNDPRMRGYKGAVPEFMLDALFEAKMPEFKEGMVVITKDGKQTGTVSSVDGDLINYEDENKNKYTSKKADLEISGKMYEAGVRTEVKDPITKAMMTMGGFDRVEDLENSTTFDNDYKVIKDAVAMKDMKPILDLYSKIGFGEKEADRFFGKLMEASDFEKEILKHVKLSPNSNIGEDDLFANDSGVEATTIDGKKVLVKVNDNGTASYKLMESAEDDIKGLKADLVELEKQPMANASAIDRIKAKIKELSGKLSESEEEIKPEYSDVIVENADGEVLLLKRADDDDLEPSKLGFAGGKIEEGETPEEAALRELKEETGLDLESVELVESITNDDGTVSHYYKAELPEGQEVEISDEHQDVVWMPKEELSEAEDIIFGNNERFAELCNDEKQELSENFESDVVSLLSKNKFVREHDAEDYDYKVTFDGIESVNDGVAKDIFNILNSKYPNKFEISGSKINRLSEAGGDTGALEADMKKIDDRIMKIVEEMNQAQSRKVAAEIQQGNAQDDSAIRAATATIQQEDKNLKRLMEEKEAKFAEKEELKKKIEEQKQLPNPNK